MSMHSDSGPDSDEQLRSRRLLARLLLGRAVADDRVMLADQTMLAALDGSRALTAGERAALQQSPATLRRFRHLADRARQATGRSPAQAANDALWRGSAGMLRAADDGAPLAQLRTDDRYWTLDFLADGASWQVILKLAGDAPFAARLMREQPMLRVLDGAGAIILQGRLDADGECEHGWPFETAPAPHFHLHGATFAVEPAAN